MCVVHVETCVLCAFFVAGKRKFLFAYCTTVVAGGSSTKPNGMVKMPAPIERCVRKQNLLFLHNRNQFSAEYFRFMRRLLLSNVPHTPTALSDDRLVSFISIATDFESQPVC
jgi:hypothetical protein